MKRIKRAFDLIVSLTAMVILAPLFLVLCIWIKIDSPGPIFFRQMRIGRRVSHFDILKFRTMRTDTPQDVPTHLLENPEQYITKAGRFLRKTSLDELPQLINIIKGDMSIVGPRPALWNQYDLVAERHRYGANNVIPGLTGWAQVHGRDTISIEEKARLDGYYVENMSLWLDIKCLFLTVASVLKHDGVKEGGTGAQREKSDKKEDSAPLVSVVIATYHREVELRHALSSLMHQTYKNIEVILVDDNADQSWNSKVEEIVRKWHRLTDIPICYIQHEKNMGSAASRNEGIKSAAGTYITFLDDDDKYLPEKIEHQLSHMMEKKSDFSIMDLALYNEEGKLEEKRTRHYLRENEYEDKERMLAYHLMYHLTGTDTLMFRSEYLEQIGGFPLIDVGDEFYLMKEAISAGGRFSYLPVCEVKALVHSQTEGLSSREGKITGENNLYEYKKQFFGELKKKEVRRIKMRHHLVLAYAYMRNREYGKFFGEGCRAVMTAPVACVGMICNRD
ncbi:MAG: glycosyltransferase [Clostridia bacterium]|nr:glycosyltransferase [Clostridia bacterium]